MAASDPYGGFPDERTFREHLARLERHATDRAAADELRAGRARDAMTGNVIPRHVYRLSCGHLTAVNGTPLPARQRALWCGGTGDQGPGPDRRPAHRPGWYTVTEHLTDY